MRGEGVSRTCLDRQVEGAARHASVVQRLDTLSLSDLHDTLVCGQEPIRSAPDNLLVPQPIRREEVKKMTTYVTPSLTRLGAFKRMTKSLGSAPQRDIFRRPALIVIFP